MKRTKVINLLQKNVTPNWKLFLKATLNLVQVKIYRILDILNF